MSAPSHAGVGPAIFCWLRSPGATHLSCAMLRWLADFPWRLDADEVVTGVPHREINEIAQNAKETAAAASGISVPTTA